MHELLRIDLLNHVWIWSRARATRAHLITACVISALFIANLHNIDFDLNVDCEDFVSKFYEALNGNNYLSYFANIMDYILIIQQCYGHVNNIHGKLEYFKDNLNKNKAAKHWLMYIETINILCKFT